MSKVGIFGGSFDPLHIGHYELAVQVKRELKLSELLIVPANDPPLKDKSCSASFADRLGMIKAAFGGMDGFAVSDIEKKLGGRSYTINTVRALREIYPPKTEFHLIIGGDQLFRLPEWFRYEALLKECKVTAVTRGEISYAEMQEFANELGYVRVLNMDIPDISSTALREKLKNGGDVSGLIPAKALEYINERGLYRG